MLLIIGLCNFYCCCFKPEAPIRITWGNCFCFLKAQAVWEWALASPGTSDIPEVGGCRLLLHWWWLRLLALLLEDFGLKSNLATSQRCGLGRLLAYVCSGLLISAGKVLQGPLRLPGLRDSFPTEHLAVPLPWLPLLESALTATVLKERMVLVLPRPRPRGQALGRVLLLNGAVFRQEYSVCN